MLSRFVNVFLIATPDFLTLIDTGVAGSEEHIFRRIRNLGRNPDEIAYTILTHAHPDHIGAAQAIREATGSLIAAHGADRAWIEDPVLQNRERPVPGFSQLVGGPVPVDRILSDGEIIEIGERLALKVIHTPGHLPGSVSFLVEPGRALFTGDALPLRDDLPIYDDPVMSLRSIERFKAIEGISSLFSAWDEPRAGEEIPRALDEGYHWINQVHEAVR